MQEGSTTEFAPSQTSHPMLGAEALPRDYWKLQLKAVTILVDIKAKLLEARADRSFINIILESHERAEVERLASQRSHTITLESGDAETKAAYRRYVQDVLQPVYSIIPETVREEVRTSVEELVRFALEIPTFQLIEAGDSDYSREELQVCAHEAEVATSFEQEPDSAGLLSIFDQNISSQNISSSESEYSASDTWPRRPNSQCSSTTEYTESDWPLPKEGLRAQVSGAETGPEETVYTLDRSLDDDDDLYALPTPPVVSSTGNEHTQSTDSSQDDIEIEWNRLIQQVPTDFERASAAGSGRNSEDFYSATTSRSLLDFAQENLEIQNLILPTELPRSRSPAQPGLELSNRVSYVEFDIQAQAPEARVIRKSTSRLLWETLRGIASRKQLPYTSPSTGQAIPNFRPVLFRTTLKAFSRWTGRWFMQRGSSYSLPRWHTDADVLHELETIEPTHFSPFSLCEELNLQQMHSSSRTASNFGGRVPFTRTLFGSKLCGPQYHELRMVYLSQLNRRHSEAIRDAAIAIPDTARASALVNILLHLAENIAPEDSVLSYINSWSYISGFRGSTSYVSELDSTPQVDVESTSQNSLGHHRSETLTPLEGWTPENVGHLLDFSNMGDERKKALEWMLFALQLLLSINLNLIRKTRDSFNYRLIDDPYVCNTSFEEILRSIIPAQVEPYGERFGPPIMISPQEISARMLQEWKGVEFEWTSDLREHLELTADSKKLRIYNETAFCYLHWLAKDSSYLHKTNFKNYHRLLCEVAETYLLLFGKDQRCHQYFNEFDVKCRTDGFYDIFTLPRSDTKPRAQYNLWREFPVYGERVLELQSLLQKPNGLRGLWRDNRDSLQWYTFWAVAFVGAIGILLGFVQIALAGIQVWASIQAIPSPS